jgi:tetratricopeptide (TPR) repeat protein
MHLGMVTAERVYGDRAENLELAIGTMRAALEEVANVDDPAFSAMLRTNKAVMMYRRERGDRVPNLQEAADLCRSALDYRSPERNANDWAYSQLNLANALDALAARGEASSEEAREAYLQVIEQEDAISERWLVGDAHHMLGRQGLWLAHRSAEEIVDDHAAGIEEPDPTFILNEARDHLLRARDLTRHGSDRMRYGMILEALSDALVRLGDDDLAITVMQEALTILRPKTSPRPCATTAGRLGGLLSERGQWRDAADAYRTAVEATEFTFHSRLDTASRETETRNSGNLHRWAAYAYARAGDPIEAALVLERGRARELRRRLILTALDEETAAGIPAALGDELRAASEALLTAPLDSDGSVEGRRLQEAVSAIRALPGLADFASDVRWENVTAALEPGWPLIYVDPTPAGTLLLCITCRATRESRWRTRPSSRPPARS